jgi:integrase/recombinase XerD
LTQKGGPFERSVKRRVNVEGQSVDYLAADSLQTYVTDLYRRAGLGRGFSTHSGRRTFASRLVSQGQSLDTVQLLLGHAHAYASDSNVIFDAVCVGIRGGRPSFAS